MLTGSTLIRGAIAIILFNLNISFIPFLFLYFPLKRIWTGIYE